LRYSLFPLLPFLAMESQAAEQVISRMPRGVGSPILVATDGHPHADTALIATAFLAGRAGANVQVFSVVERSTPSYRERNRMAGPSHDLTELRNPSLTQEGMHEDLAARRALVTRQVALTVGEAADWPITVRRGPLGQASKDLVVQSDAQLLVIGQRVQRRADARSGGRHATHALMQAAIPVYIAAPTLRGIARRVVIALDFGVTDVRAAHFVSRLSAVDANVYLVHVLPRWSAQNLEERRRRLQDVERALRAGSDARVESILLVGDAAQEILGFADGIRADVIACGISSRPFLPDTDPYQPQPGHVTRGLIGQASCSMLIAPRVSVWQRRSLS